MKIFKKTYYILLVIGVILSTILLININTLHSGSLILGYALGIYCTIGVALQVKQDRYNKIEAQNKLEKEEL